MKRLRLGQLATALGLCVACGPAPKKPPPPPDICNPSGFSAPGRARTQLEGLGPPLGLVGQPTTVRAYGSYFACDGGAVLPASVSAQVEDPLNQPLAAQVATATVAPDALEVTSSFLFPMGVPPPHAVVTRAEVTFTPPGPGPYHVTARFSPSLGAVQADVVVLERADAGYQTIPMPFPCHDFELQLGVPLCLAPGRLRTVLDGGAVATLEAYAFHADGPDVWLIDTDANGPYVSLLTLGADGSLTPVAQRSLAGQPVGLSDAGFVTSTVFSHGRRALVLSTPFLQEVWLADGGLEVGPAVSSPVTPLSVIPWVPGVAALTWGTAFPDSALGPVEVCAVPFDGGTPGCLPGAQGASDGERVWLRSSDGSWSVAELGPAGELRATPVFGPEWSFATRPVIDQLATAPYLYDASEVGLVLPSSSPPRLTAYGPRPVGAAVTFNGGDAHLFWEWATDSQQLFYVWR